MECLLCGGKLELTDTDDRQEWKTEAYTCSACLVPYERRTIYQPQSSLVASDRLYIDFDRLGKSTDVCLPLEKNGVCNVCGQKVSNLCPWCKFPALRKDLVRLSRKPEGSGFFGHICGHIVKVAGK